MPSQKYSKKNWPSVFYWTVTLPELDSEFGLAALSFEFHRHEQQETSRTLNFDQTVRQRKQYSFTGKLFCCCYLVCYILLLVNKHVYVCGRAWGWLKISDC